MYVWRLCICMNMQKWRDETSVHILLWFAFNITSSLLTYACAFGDNLINRNASLGDNPFRICTGATHSSWSHTLAATQSITILSYCGLNNKCTCKLTWRTIWHTLCSYISFVNTHTAAFTRNGSLYSFCLWFSTCFKVMCLLLRVISYKHATFYCAEQEWLWINNFTTNHLFKKSKKKFLQGTSFPLDTN